MTTCRECGREFAPPEPKRPAAFCGPACRSEGQRRIAVAQGYYGGQAKTEGKE